MNRLNLKTTIDITRLNMGDWVAKHGDLVARNKLKDTCMQEMADLLKKNIDDLDFVFVSKLEI